jgi:hypothetical protein
MDLDLFCVHLLHIRQVRPILPAIMTVDYLLHESSVGYAVRLFFPFFLLPANFS